MTFARRLIAEALGTALLLAVVVGSGIMAEQLSGGNVAIALLANALATGAALPVLILVFAPFSGAHFNPVVTLAAAATGDFRWPQVPLYCAAQIIGAFAGVLAAHAMFAEPLLQVSTHVRTGGAQWWSEFIASFGLLAVIHGCRQRALETIALAVGGYITAAYWFTASTSFANPAVTIARAATDTFAGIRPADTIGFIIAQLLGAGSATLLFSWLQQENNNNGTDTL